MTTVVYDGMILAADSRSTHGHAEHICSVCNNKSRRHSDSSKKIHTTFPDANFRGQKILAAAGSGSVQAIGDLLSALRHEDGIEKVYAHYRLFAGSVVPPAKLLVVAEKNVFTIEPDSNSKDLNVKEHPRDAKIAIGSGEKAALMAMQLTGCGAVAAIQKTTAIDEMTGGDVMYVDCNQEKIGKPAKATLANAKELIAQAVANHDRGALQAVAETKKPARKPRAPKVAPK